MGFWEWLANAPEKRAPEDTRKSTQVLRLSKKNIDNAYKHDPDEAEAECTGQYFYKPQKYMPGNKLDHIIWHWFCPSCNEQLCNKDSLTGECPTCRLRMEEIYNVPKAFPNRGDLVMLFYVWRAEEKKGKQ